MITSESITKTTCPYCGVGCGVVVSKDSDGTITVKGDEAHPANYGRLCSKGSALADTTGLEGRLLSPRINGQQATWDQALNKVSSEFKRIIDQHGPDAVAFYVSGQLLTEDYYVANKLMKGFIGSANIDTNSRLCMSSAVAGYKRAFGSDTVPCSYQDLEQANLIIIEGSNLAWCHPVVFQRIVQAKKERPELKIVVIDPRQTATCDIADLHLDLTAGSDANLFNGLLHYLSTHGHVDQDFIHQHTDGVIEALAAADTSSGKLSKVAELCGLSEKALTTFFQWFARTEKTVTLYSQGVNQSSSGTDKSNSIINCHLLTGRIGKKGMGPFSITGQPNAMGGREVGGLSNQLAAHMELNNTKHNELVSRFWQTESLAKNNGAKAVEMFNDVASGKIKAIWIMATNPVVSMPDADKVKAALTACDLVVVSDCEAQTDTTACANILLPALSWGEKSGTVTNSERRISRQRNFLPAPGSAREDWWIICQVAKRMGFESEFDYQSNADIFREHAALSGFENEGQRDFDISALSKITQQDYEGLDPIQWPVTEAKPEGTARLFRDNQFFTPNGRAKFIVIKPRPPVHKVNDRYPLLLNTGRIRDQWHTMTRTARSYKLNAHIAEPKIEIHQDDAESYGLDGGRLARVSSQWGELIGRVQISNKQNVGAVFIPIHWNQQFAANARVDVLVSPEVDPISGQPEFKQTPVNLVPYQAAWTGFVLSKQPLPEVESFVRGSHWVKVKGQHFWRYELAAETQWSAPIAALKSSLGHQGEWLEYSDQTTSSYRVAQVAGGQLRFVAMITENHDLPTRSWLSQLFSEPVLTDEMRMCLLAGEPGEGIVDCGPIVCACFGVGQNTIEDIVKSGKATTAEQIGDCLKAGTNCGSCIPELKSLAEKKQQN